MLGRSTKRSSGSRQAENFDLLIWKAAEGYRARVRDPESGREASSDFVRPFSANDVHGLRAGGAHRDLKSPPPEVGALAHEIGKSLFQTVFSREVLALWRLRLHEAERTRRSL